MSSSHEKVSGLNFSGPFTSAKDGHPNGEDFVMTNRRGNGTAEGSRGKGSRGKRGRGGSYTGEGRPSATAPLASGLPSNIPVSSTLNLWYQSRILPDGSIRIQGSDRPLNIKNLKIAAALARLVLWRFVSMMWNLSPLRASAFLFGKTIKGVVPAFRVWAQSQLLDQVQASLSGQPTSNSKLFSVAALMLLAGCARTVVDYLTQSNESLLRLMLNQSLETQYFSSQLSLSIPSLSHPVISSLFYEAGCFSAFEPRVSQRGKRPNLSPWDSLSSGFDLITGLFEVASGFALLYRTISGAGIGSGGGKDSWISTFIISLSFLPSLLAFLRDLSHYTFIPIPSMGTGKGGKRKGLMESYQSEQEVKILGRAGQYKQEVVLFNLKDWILEKFRVIKEDQLANEELIRGRVGTMEVGLKMGEESVSVAFYTLLALRPTPSLSLGSIRLYQSTAESLVNSMRRMVRNLEGFFQTLFYLSAFFETNRIAALGGLLAHPLEGTQSYEVTRQAFPLGMKIVAENLSFTYPGETKPTLHNINLTVEAGETLAIVGFNGGGKSTLVKVLMRLYDHQGTLKINDVDANFYDPTELHSRITACFQDFSKYTLSLRENIGIGNVLLMDNDASIEAAIHKGGAEGILATVGMDGKLNRQGVPDAGGPNQDGVGVDDAGGEEGGELSFGPPPGPPPPEFADGPPRDGRGPPPGGGPPPGFSGPGGMGPPSFRYDDNPREDDKKPLSGGQWSRVALSRAFLRAEDADLVVFDEPSAALDPRAENSLFERIHSLSSSGSGNITTIYISHRFSTVRKASKIAVVEGGTIVELGSHTELMKITGGRYAELFNLQKEGFN